MDDRPILGLKAGEFIVRMQLMVGTEEGNEVFDVVGSALVNDPRGQTARQSLEAVAAKLFAGAGVRLFTPGVIQTHDSES
jgi:hypothetical protein